MADQDHFLEFQFVGHRADILGQTENGPDLAVLTRFAMTREVECHDQILVRERVGLVPPEGPIAGPAVYEHQCRVAFAANVIDDAYAIGGVDRAGLYAGSGSDGDQYKSNGAKRRCASHGSNDPHPMVT